MTDNAQAALGYAARGWPVLPCHHPTTGGCSCGRPDCGSIAKHPRVQRGLHAASVDAEQVGEWWRRWPRANIGIRTGEPSGLVVVDVDPAHGGDNTLERLIRQHGPMPDTYQVETGSRGAHIYFAHPGTTVKNDAGRRLGPGLDVRGDGGYILAPPSLHAAGRRYHPVTDIDMPLAPLPEWMAERLAQRDTPHKVAAVTYEVGFARRAMDRAANAVTHARPGTRNDTLNRAAFRLGRLIDDRELTRPTVEGVLDVAATAAGLSPTEARATIRSALDAATRTRTRSAVRTREADQMMEIRLPLPGIER